jgi:hypothetical protein
MNEQCLIEKRGLYYRPESRGYTGLKREAGRYSFDDAAVIAGPNGPDGARDGIIIWNAANAPEFSSRCPWDVKMFETARNEAYERALDAAADYMAGQYRNAALHHPVDRKRVMDALKETPNADT